MKVTIRRSGAFFLALLCLSLCFVQPAVARRMDGQTLAQKVYERDDGRDSYARVKMVLVDKRGNKRTRLLLTANKDFGSLTKSYIRFTSPASIKGTAFLTWEYEDRDDDQFLYLPALRRVRRIVARQKKSRFVNTDYTYEDMQQRKVEKDNHKILKTEKYKKYDCWVLESIPREKNSSQYGKKVSWITKNIYLPIKTDFYDKKGRLVKVYSAQSVKRIDGIWTVMESEMHDLKRKHRTLMTTGSIRYNRGIPDRVFTRRYLQSPGN
jgi:hypothetical protein